MDAKIIFCCFLLWMSSVECLFTNTSRLHHDFPPITEGEACVKGRMYRMSCNTCHCGENNALYCTKMACLQDEERMRLKALKTNKALRAEKTESSNDDINVGKLVGPCVPGKIFRSGCSMCHCNDKGKQICGKDNRKICNDLKLSDVISPLDVGPSIPSDLFWKLPILPHSAVACKPGKMYAVNCNTCLCLENQNLLCEQRLCLDQDDENKSEAKKWSGTPCKGNDTSLTTRCIRCSCQKNVTDCRALPGCVSPDIVKLHGAPINRLSLNIKKEECKPKAVYKVDCNFCYCQSDHTMRCTQKTCLTYRQTLMLKKQRTYLEKHGL